MPAGIVPIKEYVASLHYSLGLLDITLKNFGISEPNCTKRAYAKVRSAIQSYTSKLMESGLDIVWVPTTRSNPIIDLTLTTLASKVRSPLAGSIVSPSTAVIIL